MCLRKIKTQGCVSCGHKYRLTRDLCVAYSEGLLVNITVDAAYLAARTKQDNTCWSPSSISCVSFSHLQILGGRFSGKYSFQLKKSAVKLPSWQDAIQHSCRYYKKKDDWCLVRQKGALLTVNYSWKRSEQLLKLLLYNTGIKCDRLYYKTFHLIYFLNQKKLIEKQISRDIYDVHRSEVLILNFNFWKISNF